MSRPNLFELHIWERFENRALEVFTAGLIDLAQKEKLPKQENFISRELYECCRTANRALRRQGRGVEYVLPEVHNLPLVGDELRASRLSKCPDFTCGFHDDSVGEQEDPDLYLVVECKRLGEPSPASWVLNKNYVEHGIARFENPDWGYAEGLASALMIGYIQSMDPASILAEVSQHAIQAGLPAVAFASGQWSNQGLTALDFHTFDRRILPTPFRLRHFWIDLRHREFYDVPDPKAKNRKKAKPKTTTKKKAATKKSTRVKKAAKTNPPPAAPPAT